MHELLLSLGRVVGLLIKLAGAGALLFFLWGLMIFIFKSNDAASHEEGRHRMIWGIIALFVLVSVWGLVHFLQVAFGLEFDIPPVRGTIPHQICTHDPVLNRDICTMVP